MNLVSASPTGEERSSCRRTTLEALGVRLLFICAQNRLRSPTAEHVFAVVPGFETDSAGISPDAENPITPELIAWADVILVMEPTHRVKLTKSFSKTLRGKRLVCLDIPDNYAFMDFELVRLLWSRVTGAEKRLGR